MSDTEEIYGHIWVSTSDLTADSPKEAPTPRPPPRNESLMTSNTKINTYINFDDLSIKLSSQSCLSFEGESVENLDIDSPTFEQTCDISSAIDDTSYTVMNTPKADLTVPFPKKPCYSEFGDKSSLEYYGPISQIFQKITTSRKERYGVLLSDKFVLFKKPDHKVSKVQIPIDRISGIYWYSNTNCTTKNDCNKFKIDTLGKCYKFQCSSHDNAGLWINRIAKLLINRGYDVVREPPVCILKAVVAIESVNGKRIFTLEPQHTLAYYESEDDFVNDIAMHRIQLRSSGVRRDSSNLSGIQLTTSYRNYKLFFENPTICAQWFSELSTSIHKAISSTMVSNSVKSGDTVMAEIYANVSNRRCADCGGDSPEWASVNLFVTLCNNCSGLHRGLGRHVSAIQGILTDEVTWQDPHIVKLFRIIGNKNANDFFLATHVASGSDRRLVSEKYVKKLFIGRKELIFEQFNDKQALNEEFMKVVRTDDVMQTMKLFHIGADINSTNSTGLTVFGAAEESGQYLQLAFLNNQSKDVIRDWRNDLFNLGNTSLNTKTSLHKRLLYCSINGSKRELRQLLIGESYIQILENDGASPEICRVLFENICLIREKEQNSTDQIYLIVILRETELPQTNLDVDQMINVIEFHSCNVDQSNDVRDFKNLIALKICPSFRPTTSFDCLGWIILSTPNEEWRPYLAVLSSNRYLDFHDPTESGNSLLSIKLDLRKVQKIEEMKDQCFQTSCPYKMYNLASICLISSVIYHIRSDTKFAHEEHLEAFKLSWNKRDFSLSNQFLTKDNVPLAVHKMIQFLHIHGSQIEGPFRRVGSVKEADKIYNELINDPGSYMLKDCTAHDVASALKLFFRKLDDPLLTKKLFKSWIAAVEIKDPEEQLLFYKSIVEKLPPVNYRTLRLLIQLLVEIVINTAVTQMDSQNLSTSFNTCLLISGSQDHCFSHTNLQVLPFLLDHYRVLFEVSEEEEERAKKIRKGLEQISNDKMLTESTLLRQVYVHDELRTHLKNAANFEKESSQEKCDPRYELYARQTIIEQSMTSESLKQNLFHESPDSGRTMLFEERSIDEFHMHRLIYRPENLFSVINSAETFEPKASRRWVFKAAQRVLEQGPSSRRSFRCWGFLSPKAKNKVFVELNETGQLNFWKNEDSQELLANFSIKNILLYRACRDLQSKLVAFKEKKQPAANNLSSNLSSNFPKISQIFSFNTKSSYHYISFVELSDCELFLYIFDQSRLQDLVPIQNRVGMPVCV